MRIMRDAERSFVERWSRILASEGLPPVAGRLWAWLLVCEPREQSVDDIAEAIGASRGAISGAVRWLEPSGLIHRTRRPGDRRDYWSVSDNSAVRAIENRQRALRPSLDTLENAMASLSDRDGASLQRLRDVHELYTVMVDVVDVAVDQFKTRRAAKPLGVPAGKD
jgi:DNA-binding transcriptional regulator GbsR (MarR family)